MKASLMTVILSVSVLLATSAMANPVATNTTCRSVDGKLTYTCTVELKQNGQLLPGVEISVSAGMTSMPMAHNIRPVTAKPIGEASGKYTFEIELEMHGEWKIIYDISKPTRDRLHEKIMFSSKGSIASKPNMTRNKSDHEKHKMPKKTQAEN
jgi:hypothetical protein